MHIPLITCNEFRVAAHPYSTKTDDMDLQLKRHRTRFDCSLLMQKAKAALFGIIPESSVVVIEVSFRLPNKLSVC